MKGATLTDQLPKAREVLKTFLENYVDSSTNQLFFPKGTSVWPECHSDLEKSVYSAKGIQGEVKKVLATEFVSSVLSIKLLCTCPQDVFELLLKVTNFRAVLKNGEEARNVINSTKSLGVFTLRYCTKATLLQTLTAIYARLQEFNGLKLNLTKFASDHSEHTKFNAMLNAIVSDAKLEPKGLAKKFLVNIGQPNSEGFYEEVNFQQVFFLQKFLLKNSKLYKRSWTSLREKALTLWNKLGGKSNTKLRPEKWHQEVLMLFFNTTTMKEKGSSHSQVSQIFCKY